jgi:hypothetical protein
MSRYSIAQSNPADCMTWALYCDRKPSVTGLSENAARNLLADLESTPDDSADASDALLATTTSSAQDQKTARGRMRRA